MKRTIALILFLLCAVLPVMAQEERPTLPVEPAATLAPVATAEATQSAPVIVNVEAPDTPAPVQDDGIKAVAAIGWIGFLLVLMALAYVLLLLMRELRKSAAAGDQSAKNLLGFVTATQNMLPVDEVLKLLDRAEGRAKETPTPGEIDDVILSQVRAYVYELFGKEMPTPPAQTAG